MTVLESRSGGVPCAGFIWPMRHVDPECRSTPARAVGFGRRLSHTKAAHVRISESRRSSGVMLRYASSARCSTGTDGCLARRGLLVKTRAIPIQRGSAQLVSTIRSNATRGPRLRFLFENMRIAQVAPLAESVPPEGYGGTERVVSYLTEELVRLGHDVTLFATADSETSADLEPMCPRGARSDAKLDARLFETRMLAEAYRRADEFDVIHCHTDYVGLPLAEHVRTPTMVTLHGRLDLPGLPTVFRGFPDVAYVSISDSQRAPVPDIQWVATVYHGLPKRLYRFRPDSGDYLLFLGRICPEKGPDRAIRIATRARVPLRIAAKVDPGDQEYFETAVKPL